MKLMKSEEPECTTDISSRKEMNTLKIESRHLNPNNEFKRIFGPKVVNTSVEFRYLIFGFNGKYINDIMIVQFSSLFNICPKVII